MLKLDAINQMLGAIGQVPVTSINQHPDVLFAVAVLDRVDKKIQGKGWWFNTDYGLTLNYDSVTKEVIVPANTLGVDPVDPEATYVQRGTKLYDHANATFEIGEDVDVNIKQRLEFDELPENAAAYIAAKATHDFVLDKTGDQKKLDRLAQEVQITRIDLNKDDIKYSNIKLADNPSVVELLGGIRPSR